MIENGFVYAVNKSLEKQKKKESRRSIKENKLAKLKLEKEKKIKLKALYEKYNK